MDVRLCWACSTSLFPENYCGDVSEEYDERFHQDIRGIEERYQGFDLKNVFTNKNSEVNEKNYHGFHNQHKKLILYRFMYNMAEVISMQTSVVK